jgi:hypothetical protein
MIGRIIQLAILAIVIVAIKYVLEYIGVVIPQIVWVIVGCVVGIVTLLWVGGMVGGHSFNWGHL